MTHVYDASRRRPPPPATSDIGLLLNYSLFAAGAREPGGRTPFYQGANATLDARAFSELGVLSQSAIVGEPYAGASSVATYTRLDTSYVYSVPDWATTLRMGDSISRTTEWSRPIRYGGFQVARDFDLRSDIISQPMPGVVGTAAAPTSVDVLVNGVKAYSQQVGAGPFSLTNLPIVGADGSAQIQLRDSTGRLVTQNITIFDTPNMLAKGLADFSLDGGFPRLNYGYLSDDYRPTPIGSATIRYGLSDRITLEAHAEGGAGLVNGGAGLRAAFGPYGVLGVAASGSAYAGNRETGAQAGPGGQIYADWQDHWNRYTFGFGTQRTIGHFQDLAGATAGVTYPPHGVLVALAGSPAYNPALAPAYEAFAASSFNFSPPRALDRASVSAPLFDDRTTASLSAVRIRQADGVTTSKLLTATLMHAFDWKHATLAATSYADVDANRSWGAFVSLAIPLGPDISATVGGEASNTGGAAANVQLAKAQQPTDGTAGWRIAGNLGANQSDYGEVDGSYRTSVGQIAATATQTKTSTAVTAQFDGSVGAVASRDGFAAAPGNRVDGGYALVDARAPGVVVMQDNHELGATNWWGQFLVPNLRPYDRNHIAIRGSGQSTDFDVAETDKTAVPRGPVGLLVKFDGSGGKSAALVSFVDPAGKPIRLGVRGYVDGRENTFVVGYDGKAYVRGLTPGVVTVVINLLSHDCHAHFIFAPVTGRQAILRGVPCL